MNWLPDRWEATEVTDNDTQSRSDALCELWKTIVHIETMRSGDRARGEYFANTFCYAVQRNLLSLQSVIKRALDVAQTTE